MSSVVVIVNLFQEKYFHPGSGIFVPFFFFVLFFVVVVPFF